VTHVGLQDRQQRAGVLAAVEPRPQVIDRKNMTKIMDTGAVALAAVGNARLP
jgi:hypothetical protein